MRWCTVGRRKCQRLVLDASAGMALVVPWWLSRRERCWVQSVLSSEHLGLNALVRITEVLWWRVLENPFPSIEADRTGAVFSPFPVRLPCPFLQLPTSLTTHCFSPAAQDLCQYCYPSPHCSSEVCPLCWTLQNEKRVQEQIWKIEVK